MRRKDAHEDILIWMLRDAPTKDPKLKDEARPGCNPENSYVYKISARYKSRPSSTLDDTYVMNMLDLISGLRMMLCMLLTAYCQRFHRLLAAGANPDCFSQKKQDQGCSLLMVAFKYFTNAGCPSSTTRRFMNLLLADYNANPVFTDMVCELKQGRAGL